MNHNLIALSLLGMGLFACNTDKSGDSGTDDSGMDTGDVVQDDIVIAGDWDDNWWGTHSIDSGEWVSGDYYFSITDYDNEEGWAIAQNDSGNAWNPDLWSKFEWMWDTDGNLYYCQSTPDAATEEDAINAAGADRSDLTMGCGGYSWSELKSSLGISGSYEDNFGGFHSLNAFAWESGSSSFLISLYDVDASWAVAQNHADNTWYPELWSKFEWTWGDDGDLYYCQTAFGEESEQDAMNVASSDVDDLASGCAGYSWTQLRTILGISGDYDDNWGGTHSIDSFTWQSGSSAFHISLYDEESNWLVAQNDSGNAWSPDLWSKFEWTWDAEGALYYCQTVFGEATEEDALMADPADSEDLLTGCAGYSWNELKTALAITGDYDDDTWGTHSINAFKWTSDLGSFHISDYDNDTGWAVAQNDSLNETHPDLWSKFEWAWDIDGNLFYCHSSHDAATEADAIASVGADSEDFDLGCLGTSWTQLREPLNVSGFWQDEAGSDYSVNAFAWIANTQEYNISQYSNDDGWIVAQNGPLNFAAGKWTKVQWTWDVDGELFYCPLSIMEETEEDALNLTLADSADLLTGCLGQTWIGLRTALDIKGEYSFGSTLIEINPYFINYNQDDTVFYVSQHNNDNHWLIAQNSVNNSSNGGLWSKFEWAIDTNGDSFLCHSASDAADEQAAIDAAGADSSDMLSGCNGSSWMLLSVQ